MLAKLIKTTAKGKKRLGRGYGSGRGGHTSSRGAKGDKARGETKLLFEGVKTKKSLVKRLPFTRGKDKLRPSSVNQPVNVGQLTVFAKDEAVTLDSLFDKKLIKSKRRPVKILGDGELNWPVKVYLPCSKLATEKIIKAGGEIFAQA